MDAVKEIFNSPEHAKNYDEKAKDSNWLGSEILIQLIRQYIKPGESVLDLGIGTGLTSILFRATGLHIYGMDFSAEMLKVCKEKNIAKDLKEHDLRKTPYPYESKSMNHVICGGVFHIFKDLNLIFEEVSRIICPNGTFAFTCADHENNDDETQKDENHKHMGKSIAIYQHAPKTIETTLKRYNFTLRGTSDFFVTMGDRSRRRFKAYMAIKQ